jgi:hypothetical protein
MGQAQLDKPSPAKPSQAKSVQISSLLIMKLSNNLFQWLSLAHRAHRTTSFRAFSSKPVANNHTNNISSSARLTTATLRSLSGYIVDMDGVLYHQGKIIPGALDFIAWLKSSKKKFLFLTNSSERSPKELSEKLKRMGIEVGSEHFYTSALATAQFLRKQKANGSAYVIGEPGLINALYDVGLLYDHICLINLCVII